jgi:protein translocase SecG subunit
MFSKSLEIIQLVLAVLVIVSILLQQQGSGLGGAFGGEGNFYRSKRGLEKVLFYSTIALIVFFIASVSIPLFLA